MAEIKVIEAIPVVITEDVDGAKQFLIDKLGFTDGWSWGEPVMYGGAKIGGKSVHLLKGTPPGDKLSTAYIWLEDVDAAYKQFEDNGANPGGLDDRPYQMRDFTVLLPGKGEITFGSQMK